MSIVQMIECLKCGNNTSWNDPKKMPWEIWPQGCPKCGAKKVDVTVLLDKTGRIRSLKVLNERSFHAGKESSVETAK